MTQVAKARLCEHLGLLHDFGQDFVWLPALPGAVQDQPAGICHPQSPTARGPPSLVPRVL